MGINEISNQGAVPHSSNNKKTRESPRASQGKKDKVEISSEAKSLFEAGQNKRLEEIRKKIDAKYYFQSDVTEKVAEALLKDMTG